MKTATSRFWLFFCVLLSFHVPTTQASSLKEIDDFHYLSQQARSQNIPIMIMFTAAHCEFCHQLKREVLDPMIRGGLYDGYAMYMGQISLDRHRTLKFSETETIQKRQFARMYGYDITPTVMFVDFRGVPVAEPLIGVMDVQLYAALIHARLNSAYTKMGNPMQLPVSPEDMRRPLP
jgi:thioredoxin-related protein